MLLIFGQTRPDQTYRDPGSEADVVDEREDVGGAEVGEAEQGHDDHPGGGRHLLHLHHHHHHHSEQSNQRTGNQFQSQSYWPYQRAAVFC